MSSLLTKRLLGHENILYTAIKARLFCVCEHAQLSEDEHWLVVSGPFPRGVLAALAPLCHASQSLTDDALHQLTPPRGFKLIFEAATGGDLTPLILVRCVEGGGRGGRQVTCCKAPSLVFCISTGNRGSK